MFDMWLRILNKSLQSCANKSILEASINNFWWCCTICNGNAKELREKWLSSLYSVTDRHRWEDCDIFKRCQHKKLTKKKKDLQNHFYLKVWSVAFTTLERVVKEKSLLNNLKYLTNFNHTITLEVYHSLYNKYCAKHFYFSYEGMIACTQLAVLDFNTGASLQQADTKLGELRCKQHFSKLAQSWVAKKIISKKDKIYLNNMMDEVVHLTFMKEEYMQ